MKKNAGAASFKYKRHGWSRSVSKRYSRLLAQPRAPRACRIAGMSQFALTSSHKLASTLSTHGRPLPPRAMDDEPPKRTSATRPRERLRAGWNVRINALRARVHVMSIEGVAGMHGSLPGLAAGRFGVIMFFFACRLPSFAPEDPPSHASENQITTGWGWKRLLTERTVSILRLEARMDQRLQHMAHLTLSKRPANQPRLGRLPTGCGVHFIVRLSHRAAHLAYE